MLALAGGGFLPVKGYDFGQDVSSALVFELAGKRYTAVRALGMHALFDADRKLLFSGQQIVRDWAPLIAEFFGFKLIMSDRDGETLIPPPSYIFAPFYVDQDGGWFKPWMSFEDFYLPESTRTLADYHSGIRPDQYYQARVDLTADRLALSALDASVQTLRDAITQIQQIDDGASPTYDMGEFRSEMEELITESETLLSQQRAYRSEISDLHEEAHLFRAEKSLLEAALREVREEFDVAAVLPDEVACPTCGQEYANDIAERFSLVKDEGVLMEAIGVATAKLNGIQDREAKQKEKLNHIQKSLERVEHILAVERAAISFSDVVIGAGKTEAAKILRSSLGEKAADADEARDRIEGHKEKMAALTTKQRTGQILSFYREKLAEYSIELDVTLENSRVQSIQTIKAARGSEGPRGLLAYYYAFLHTRARYNSSTTFPIVVDAPNQQGQDKLHLPEIVKFLFVRAPTDTQVIVAVEEAGKDLPADVEVQTYGEKKRQVLRDSEFEDIRRRFLLYTNQMIAD